MPIQGVGFDHGSAFLKAALVHRKGEGWVLDRAVVAETAGSPPEAARAFWASANLPRSNVCALFGAGALILREIRHPLQDPEKIAQTVRYEAEPYLSLPLDETVLRYRLLARHEKGSRVLLMAMPKARLGEWLEAWKAAGVDPHHVSADAAGLWNCFLQLGPTDPAPTLLLDLGAQKTVLALFAEGELRLLRSLRVGSADAAAPEVLAQEVRRSCASEGLDPAAIRVLLTGGGLLRDGLEAALRAALPGAVDRFRFLERLEHGLTGSQAEAFEVQGAAAVGAAMMAVGADATDADFRQEEFRYRGRLPRLAGALTLACLAGAVFLGLLGYDLHRQAAAWQTEESLLKERLDQARAQTLGAPSEAQQALLAEAGCAPGAGLEAVLARLKEHLARRQESRKGDQDLVSVLDLLKALFDALPPGAEFTVTELQATQNGVTLKGLMRDESSVWSLPDAVNRAASPLLEAAPTNAQSQPDGRFAFTLTARRKR